MCIVGPAFRKEPARSFGAACECGDKAHAHRAGGQILNRSRSSPAMRRLTCSGASQPRRRTQY